MKITQVIKSLEKAGVAVKTKDNYRYFCEIGNKVGNFFRNGKESEETCFIQVRRKNDNNDSSSDYCAGWLHKTVKGAVKDLIEA